MVNIDVSGDASLGVSAIFVPRDIGSKKKSIETIKDKIEYPVKLSFKNEAKIKTFLDKNKQANQNQNKNPEGGYYQQLINERLKNLFQKEEK